jgi:phenylacetate-CoA ligase
MFKQLLDRLEKTQWLTEKEIQQMQYNALNQIVKHHREQSPWYKELTKDSKTVPIINKHDIQQAGYDFFAQQVSQDNLPANTVKTSGSTGEPLEVRIGVITGVFHSAFSVRNLIWNFKEENLRSSIIKANIDEYKEAPDWGSPYHLILKTGPAQGISIRTDIPEQNRILTEFQPNILLTFPNNLRALCELWRETSVPLKDLKYIRTMGETCTDSIKKLVKEVTGLKVIDVYSSQELGAIALTCPDSDLYHTMDENIIVEILDENDQPCAVGQEGRVVVTDLHNQLSPMIRYDVGDFAVRGPKCSCGRGLGTIHSVLGRRRNLLVHPDGRKHWPLIGFYEFGEIAKVRRFQMIQHDLHNIELLIATETELTDEQKIRFTELCTKYTGPEFNIKLTNVIGDLPVPNNGKFEDFISKL